METTGRVGWAARESGNEQRTFTAASYGLLSLSTAAWLDADPDS